MDLSKLTHLSDFTIILPKKKYKLHKLILSKCEYFNRLFQSNMLEARTNELKLQNSKDAFDIFIDVLYNDTQIETNDESIIFELIDLSFYFGFEAGIKQLASIIVNKGRIHIEPLIKYTQFLDIVDTKILYKRYNFNLQEVESIIMPVDDIKFVGKFIRVLAYNIIQDIVSLIDRWVQRHNNSQLWTCLNTMSVAISPTSISKLHEKGYLNIPQVMEKITGIGFLSCLTSDQVYSFKIKWTSYGNRHEVYSSNDRHNSYPLTTERDESAKSDIYFTLDKYDQIVINGRYGMSDYKFVIANEDTLLFEGDGSLIGDGYGKYNTQILRESRKEYRITFYLKSKS